jgi:translation initiation factor IF-2
MTARRLMIFPAAVALALAAPPAFAQDPPQHQEAAPAPQAVERVNRRAPAADGAAPARSERSRPAEARVRERADAPAPSAAAAPAAPAAAAEEQGGRRRGGGSAASGGGGRSSGGDQAVRRGGVRNPDAGGGSRGAGQAVPRAQAPRPRSGGGWAPSYGRRYFGGPQGFGYYAYDPWSWYGWGWPAYGAYGAWSGYGYGAPYGAGWGGYYGGGYGAYGGPYGWSIGGVRLRVDQRDAEVYVDGYYAGTVDDFDGIWQQLRLDDGGYRVEIKKPGFETLVFDVRVTPGRTITYRGHMVPGP